MPYFQLWQESLLAAWNQVWSSFLSFLPLLVGALLVFAVGLVIASLVRTVVERALSALGLDNLAKSAGITDYLKRADLRVSVVELLGLVAYWLLVLVFFIAAVDILGLTVVSQVLTSFLAYIPNVVAAALIFGAGMVVANLVRGLVRGALATVDHEAARPVANLSRWVVILVALFAAIGQLRVAPELVETFFQGLTWTLVLVVGLGVGLGSKDLVARLLDDWYKRVHK